MTAPSFLAPVPTPDAHSVAQRIDQIEPGSCEDDRAWLLGHIVAALDLTDIRDALDRLTARRSQ